ncbi:MAG TPA: TlpA disulfide reductase family protein, partial [Actinopolymorphaceae bacterium]|nr:TlpA disulfide reductase family protein [Actinopolymorphaceae bacterium]
GDARSSAAAPSLHSARVEALRSTTKVAPCPRLPSPDRAESAADPHGRLPDVTLPCLGKGPEVRLAAIAGRPAVLNIWAQWCSPCRKEAPLFQALHARAGDRVLVLGVDYDDPRPDWALRLAGQLDLRYPQVVDADKRLKAPFAMAVGVPGTVFVAADGRVVHITHRVYQSGPDLARDVRTYLGVGA